MIRHIETDASHIDLANLWQFTHSQQKAARSWSSQLRLMDQYLDYTFTVTQAQSIKWVEDLYPDLFKRIMARAEEGRFEALGATWVECDTNLPTGESLCRQFMFGQRYYQSRFGHRSKVFALPDSCKCRRRKAPTSSWFLLPASADLTTM